MAIKPIIARAGGSGDFEIPDEGVYLARCYKMVDVGTQVTQSQFGTKEARQVYFWWELLADADGGEVKYIDGKPFSIMNSYTLSMHPKANLRKHLDSWRGKKFTEEEAQAFDITKLLDKFCLIQVSHSPSKDGTRTYANVENIMSTKRTMTGINPVSMFTVSDPDQSEFDKLPDFLKKKIEVSPEYGTVDPASFPEDVGVEQDIDKPSDNEISKSELPF